MGLLAHSQGTNVANGTYTVYCTHIGHTQSHAHLHTRTCMQKCINMHSSSDPIQIIEITELNMYFFNYIDA